MKRQIYFVKYFLFFCLLIFSCRNVEKKEGHSESAIGESTDSMKTIESENLNSVGSISETADKKPSVDIGLPPVDSIANEKRKSGNSQSDIQTKIFRNENSNGYGYDIILNGHVYVHQPNIPALAGNNGFATSELAQKVADLVVNKIRNNILPPTLSVQELDSLGVN
jgi:hypothetical protein